MATATTTESGITLELSFNEADAAQLILERVNGQDRYGVQERVQAVAKALQGATLTENSPHDAYGFVCLIDRPLDKEAADTCALRGLQDIVYLVSRGYLSKGE